MEDVKVTRHKRWITSQAYIERLEWQEKKKKLMQEKVESKETSQRMEIQTTIRAMCKEGKTKPEILKKLIFLTAAKGYNQNFVKFYEKWIDNILTKGVQNKEDENER